jgi:hypothetical protein
MKILEQGLGSSLQLEDERTQRAAGGRFHQEYHRKSLERNMFHEVNFAHKFEYNTAPGGFLFATFSFGGT